MSFLKKLAERTQAVVAAGAQAAAERFDELKVESSVREERYDICKSCPHFVEVTSTCKKCGCFMAAKTYLSSAECPVGKWTKITIIANESSST